MALSEVPIDELVECLGRCQIVSIAGEESVCDVGEAGGSVIGEAGGRLCPPAIKTPESRKGPQG